MSLKNAVAICLISLFSATLVVLVARTLDSQAASRLEPKLDAIVNELQALRKQGGIAASPGTAPDAETAADGLVVYYFHSTTRCPTCQSIESQAKDTVQSDFASQLSSGELAWKVLNYEQPAGRSLAAKFDIQMPVVVLAKMKAGQVEQWKRLDEVWALVGDKPAFAKYVREEIKRFIAGDYRPAAPQPTKAPETTPPAIPIPDAKTSDPAALMSPPPIPIPE